METCSVFQRLICSIAIALVMPALAWAANPYEVIVARNAFGLRPPPPPAPAPVAKPPEPERDIKISGLVAFQKIRKVGLYVIEKGKQAKPYMLDEGEEKDGIKVLAIDPKKETARVRDGTRELVLDFKNHAMKPTVVAVRPPVRPTRRYVPPGRRPPLPVPNVRMPVTTGFRRR